MKLPNWVIESCGQPTEIIKQKITLKKAATYDKLFLSVHTTQK